MIISWGWFFIVVDFCFIVIRNCYLMCGILMGVKDLGFLRICFSWFFICCKKLMEKKGVLNLIFFIFEKEECFVLDFMFLKIVCICVYCIVIFVFLIGNFLIILVIRKIKMMRRKFIYYFIVNMVVVDIFFILYMFCVVSLVYVGFEW